MPRQFGQSPLAFALQQALQQGGGLVSSIPALKMQNQEFANQQQGFEQGQLAQMVRLALAQRADNRAERGMGLREREFQLGIGDRERALDNANLEAESQGILARNLSQLIQAQQQGQPFDPNQVSRVLTLDPKLGNNLLGAATSSRRETRLENTPKRPAGSLTDYQRIGLVDKVVDREGHQVLSQLQSGLEGAGVKFKDSDKVKGFVTPEALGREAQVFADPSGDRPGVDYPFGFSREQPVDSTFLNLFNRYQTLGDDTARARISANLGQYYPEIGQGGSSPVEGEVSALRQAGITFLDVQDVENYRQAGFTDEQIEQIRQAIKQ